MASQGRGGGPSNSRTKPCQHFKKGNCYYGENCTFLHEKSSDIDSYVAIQTPVAKTDPRKRYMAWKGMVRKPPPSFQTTSGVKEHHKFWKRALELLDEDNPAQHQDIARDLANDDYHGLQFIVDAAENGSSDAKENLPTSYVFIQVISHANLMSSLSTEACVGTIFTVFAGMNGERGIGLFSSMCEQALESTELFSELLGTTTQAALRVIITALSQLLNKVPRTQFCDELPDLIEQMDKVISMIAEDAPPKELEEVSAHFKLLKRLVTAANDRLAASEDTSDKPKNLKAIASTFPRDLEIPGGRHDNDFADISKIAILPTYEEVTSEQVEYLPSTNFTEPHVLADPLQRYIDSMFRLVRHDILGPVKDILRDLLQSDDLLNGRLSNPDPQAQVYLESSIEAFVSSKKHGTEAVLSFEPPAQILGKTAEQQKAWWKTSSRLGQGTLVCFVSPTPGRTSLLFFQVTCKSTSSSDLKETDERTSSIAPLQGLPSITVKLANHNREDLLLLAKLYTTKAVGVLVDFNGVILDTFVPILRNLQTIKCENQIAFQQWILPSTDEERSVTTPAYARRLDFTFSLRSITKDKGTDLVLDPEFPENLDIQELERATGLDQGQCRGLVDALTREYALIQGPPGTGKSYLGVQLLRVLLAAKQKAHLGPIVIICYTNHALDQFLKHLLDVGISRIIRIGGRSVTPELAGLNLRVERRALVNNWSRRHQEEQTDVLFEAMDEYEEQQKNIKRTHDATNVRTMNQADVIGLTTTALAGRIDMLRSLKPKIVICEEAGEVKESDIISALMPGLQQVIQIGDHKQLRPNINNYDLSLESMSGQKWQLDRSQFERRGEGEPGLDPSPLTQLNVQRRMRPEVSQLIRGVYPNLIDHESVLEAPDVVGMLDNVFWLDHSHPQDVGGDGTRVKSHSNRWETSMATALIRHLVRQGKYKAEDIALLTPYMGQLQQLRTALSRDFEICLGDLDREQLAHEEFEDESSSKKPVEKKKLLQTIRLATVDNFQGEEAKIIVVSLVRSNPQRQVGFLRTENRINVLLSRAKHGMYLIGNAATYSNVPMWADVYDILYKSNSVGTALRLCCPRHPETPIACSEPEDFSIKSPEGGCTLSCSRRLEPCGHKCQATCHSEAMHNAFTCTRSCPRIRTTCTHQCPKLCGESCGPCLTKVYCIDLPCGHTSMSMTCYQTQNLEAFKLALTFFHAATGVLALAPAVRVASIPGASSFAVVHTAHATIAAIKNATMERLVVVVSNHARSKKTARVDLLEFRKYSEIDLDEAPIVVLGCGHFFTGETLDGLVGLGEVYHTDMSGNFTGMKNMSGTLAQKTPCCPDCKRSIRQFATRRYNRVINRAVMDEICKRFLIKGQAALDKLNKKLAKLETALATSRRSSSLGPHHTATTFFRERHAGIKSLEKSAESLLKLMGEENQPAKKLINAIATSQSAATGGFNSITQLMEALKLSHSAPGDQLLLGARLVILEAQQIQLMDAFMVSKSKGKKLHENALDLPCMDEWFKTCLAIMKDAMDVKLNRIVIATILGLAKIARGDAWTAKPEARSKSARKESVHIKVARDLLPIAVDRCSKLGDNDVLKKRVGDMVELYKPRHEEVTPEELASIRSAMVTGPHGMATHSGHCLRSENAVCRWRRQDVPSAAQQLVVLPIVLLRECIELRRWRLLLLKYDVMGELLVDVCRNRMEDLLVVRGEKAVSLAEHSLSLTLGGNTLIMPRMVDAMGRC
ncbi:hypothetical protein FGSG_11696 [Fusarium graminearum PH-1]|uniref:hypothetical protein n=1 Tax=Gibberella zeae (strain ATCC MYA-4620 / CBS 123657 / FGSC 9075 / NRRL 31084 / PH-1) TaxID=229533 RepID=UPI00021F177F|nr:hypothetical protein FGSG_11696 [Fusarium graminearum PH-1]ESU05299.1 hypothetical protein FGSG_11696 [Fusarium graminearum PH-1]|eukprot:XP_011315784.1 hypothetical protein FGSG_11696 [Fusarium graminearum PH-1]